MFTSWLYYIHRESGNQLLIKISCSPNAIVFLGPSYQGNAQYLWHEESFHHCQFHLILFTNLKYYIWRGLTRALALRSNPAPRHPHSENLLSLPHFTQISPRIRFTGDERSCSSSCMPSFKVYFAQSRSRTRNDSPISEPFHVIYEHNLIICFPAADRSHRFITYRFSHYS